MKPTAAPLRRLRGTILIEVLVVVAAAGLAAKVAGWKPLDIFRSKPPTAQVEQLQKDLAKAQVERDEAQRKFEAARAAEERKQDEQTRYAQEMAAGAADAIQRVPAEHRVPEVVLAGDLLARTEIGLAAAVGPLDPARRAEILKIVGLALSKVEAERDQARAALDAKDAELRTAVAERERIRAQLPVLESKLETRDAHLRAVQAELAVKTGEVVQVANELDRKARDAASLGNSLQRVLFWVAVGVGTWFFLVWGLPVLLKLMRPSPVKTALREVSGWAHGALYLDAKKKIAAARAAISAPPAEG